MSNSPSTTNYEAPQIVVHSYRYTKHHSETNGRVVRLGRKKRNRINTTQVQTPQLSVEQRNVRLNLNGSIVSKTLYVVVGGETERKFITEEAALNFISNQ